MPPETICFMPIYIKQWLMEAMPRTCVVLSSLDDNAAVDSFGCMILLPKWLQLGTLTSLRAQGLH